MNDEPTNFELARQLHKLSEDMQRGFDGVHERQNTTNGKVLKSENFRVQMETSLAIFKWLFGALGIGNVVMIIKIIVDVINK